MANEYMTIEELKKEIEFHTWHCHAMVKKYENALKAFNNCSNVKKANK